MYSNKEVFFCGIAGAVGSLCGKLALSEHVAMDVCTVYLSDISFLSTGYCTVFSLAFRAVFFVLMLTFNALMLSNFLIALEKKGSLMVVIVSSSMNIILTGVMGQTILGEDVSDQWYVGAFVMLIGVALIAFSQDTRKEKIRIQTDDIK